MAFRNQLGRQKDIELQIGSVGRAATRWRAVAIADSTKLIDYPKTRWKALDEPMISQKAKYALRALVALAKAENPSETLFISDIAEQQCIPKKFLEQILLDLKRHGIVVSRRGKAGGYLLLKNPSEITFGQVLRIIEGPIAPLPCLSRTAYRRCEDCQGEENCEVRQVFARVAEATRAVLDTTTIADCIAPGVQPAIRKLAG